MLEDLFSKENKQENKHDIDVGMRNILFVVVGNYVW